MKKFVVQTGFRFFLGHAVAEFLVQSANNMPWKKEGSTNLYHEFLHCFVEPNLYFLLHTPVREKPPPGGCFLR
jgi:hypothetical protein